MKNKNNSYIIYLLSFLIVISLSNMAIAQGLTEEEIAKLTREEKIAKLEQLEIESQRIYKEMDDISAKTEKLEDHYVEYKLIKTKRDGKPYTETTVIFVKKDDIREKAERMMENLNIAEAEAMIKEYEERNEYLKASWDRQYWSLLDDLYLNHRSAFPVRVSLEKEEKENRVEVGRSDTKTVSSTNATGLKPPQWFDTGIDIQKGSTLKIKATGTWRLGPDDRKCDANGLSNYGLYNHHLYGTLLGKIGDNGAAFGIGTDYNAQVNATGRLYLGNNDSNSKDNTGSISVSIEIK